MALHPERTSHNTHTDKSVNADQDATPVSGDATAQKQMNVSDTSYRRPRLPTIPSLVTLVISSVKTSSTMLMADQPNKKSDLVAVRNAKGQFLPGNKEGGRAMGSKNRITVLKVALEEAFRDETFEDIQKVLKQVVAQALEGDKSSQRLVWDASVSKGVQSSDKEATDKKGFTVHHMHHDVNEKGDKDG